MGFTVRTGCLHLNQMAAAEVGEKTKKLRFTLSISNFHTMPDVLPQQKLKKKSENYYMRIRKES